jgi:hypothetical protein
MLVENCSLHLINNQYYIYGKAKEKGGKENGKEIIASSENC